MSTITSASVAGFDQRFRRGCSSAGNVTRSLLGYLALAGPFYVAVSLAQAFTRPGFSSLHDEWSLLALGPMGWIQTANLIATGAMTIAGAVGVRRALGPTGRTAAWAPRLLGGYGVALITAGIVRADPANGYPSGAPAGRPAQLSGHGVLHLVAGSVGFAFLIAACFVIAHGYARSGNQRAAVASRAVGVCFAVAFAGIATGSGNAGVNLGFTAAFIVSAAWTTTVAISLYRQTRQQERDEVQAIQSLPSDDGVIA
jgi:hypothetical protein